MSNFWIVTIIITSEEKHNVFIIIVEIEAHSIMIIGIIIYLEIIQLNFCKLNEYTAISIASSSNSDYVKHVNGDGLILQKEAITK